MKNVFKRIYDKTYLEGGLYHAWWMLIYNLKYKLLNFSINCSKKIAKSIERQSRLRAEKELALIQKGKQFGLYPSREVENFFISQKNISLFDDNF